jgi:hypothetical protein
MMRKQAGWGVFLLALVAFAQEKGYQPERVVVEPTRLDWEFVVGTDAPVPTDYNSRKQRYQLFVPAAYTKTRAWPLIVFVSSGDDPLGWRAWKTPCEEVGCLFAAPYGVGNTCAVGQRLRAVLDVLDDVRRSHNIDPERTYFCGLGGGVEIAARVAFALPEYAGGVLAIDGETPLPRLAHLRHRLQDRLSVALVSGKHNAARPMQEKYLHPLFSELTVRTRLWLIDESREGLPAAATLAEVFAWLEEDLKRRQTEARRSALNVEDTPGRRPLAARALARAQKELPDTDHLARSSALLEWIVARGGKGDDAFKAAELLQAIRADEVKGRILLKQTEAELRRTLRAKAKALESLGDLAPARGAWDDLARLADDVERTDAKRQRDRLTALLTQAPYLGVTFAGATMTIREVTKEGPAQQAGVQAGDAIERLGKVKVTTLSQLREQMRRLKPGDTVEMEVRREAKVVNLTVRLGAMLP